MLPAQAVDVNDGVEDSGGLGEESRKVHILKERKPASQCKYEVV
jgi:hypothetical protein